MGTERYRVRYRLSKDGKRRGRSSVRDTLKNDRNVTGDLLEEMGLGRRSVVSYGIALELARAANETDVGFPDMG